MKDYDPNLVDQEQQATMGGGREQEDLDPENLPEPVANDPHPKVQARYDLLEVLITKGFLEIDIAIGPRNILKLKSLTPHEFAYATDIAPMFLFKTEIDTDLALQRAILALAMCRVNGKNLLPLREKENYDQLISFFKEINLPFFWYLSQKLDALMRATMRVSRLLLPYSYGPPSRRLWEGLQASHRNLSIIDSRLTGIPGTQYLGLHPAQEAWAMMNSMEDKLQEFQSQYNLAKLMISPHASKDIQRLDKKEKLDRYRTLTTKYKSYETGSVAISMSSETYDEAGRKVLSPSTFKELLADMEKSVRGERDYHDEIVLFHEKKVAQSIQLEKEKLQELRRLALQNQARQEEEDSLAPAGLIIITPEEAEKRAEDIRRRKMERIEKGESSYVPTLDERISRAQKWNILPTDK
jgi:hypothetical protein